MTGWRRFGEAVPEDGSWVVLCDPEDLEPCVGQYRDGGLYWRHGAHTVHEDMWWWPVPPPPREAAGGGGTGDGRLVRRTHA